MVKVLPEVSISVLNTAPLNDQQATVLDTLWQTTSKTGTQPHPLAYRVPKIIIRSQTPQNTPPDVVLPTRKTRSNLIHQNTGTSPLHNPLNQPYPLGEDTRKKRDLWTCSLWKGDLKHSKLSKMRRQKNTQQMKEQGKTPPDLTNEEEIGSLPEK